MSDFKQKYGPWGVISGASAGLGEEFASQLAAQGLNLVLIARRADKLETIAAALREKHGIETRCIAADLGSPDFLPAIAEQTADLDVGLLVNNAGFTNSGNFLDNPIEKEAQLVDLNCRAVTLMAHHFGNRMRVRGGGGMINTASIAGFGPIPFWATYSASKSYDLLFSEALSAELKPHNIDVLALCPGATHTEFATYEGFIAKLLAMYPEEVISGALNSLGRRRVYVAGLLNKINVFSTRFMPRWLTALVFGFVIRDMVKH